jgi:hypothetical protein
LRIDGNDIQHDFFEIVDEETKLKADESLLMEISRQKGVTGLVRGSTNQQSKERIR